MPLQAPKQGTSVQEDITDWMTWTRSRPLVERVRAYGEQRIDEQQRFYEARADTARRWTRRIVLLQGAGALMSALLALDIVQFDLIGVAATLAVAGTAWVQFNVRGMSIAVDSAMDFKLAIYVRRCRDTTWTEPTWSAFVGEAEALSGHDHRQSSGLLG